MNNANYTSTSRYTKGTLSKAQYASMRGVIDYSNARMFNLFESGYSYLRVLSKPKWVDLSPGKDLLDLFCWIVEYEFRGLDGIEDIQADNLTFEDGINSLNTIGKVNQQSATEISMTFTERSGLAITKFIDYYLTGIKDPRTQAKTYHGLIASNAIAGGFENEVFTLLYMVTDNTMLGLEKAYLLANAWPSKAETSILNSTKGDIDKKEITVPWQCFVIDGEDVDELGLRCLAYINESHAVANYMEKLIGQNDSRYATANSVTSSDDTVYLDSRSGGVDANGNQKKGYLYQAVSDANEKEPYGNKSRVIKANNSNS